MFLSPFCFSASSRKMVGMIDTLLSPYWVDRKGAKLFKSNLAALSERTIVVVGVGQPEARFSFSLYILVTHSPLSAD
ncbi:Hypothetical protein NTJ_14512 [Nesidiocoris tenuis]|uniref:SLC12A transporter C-terminal domain-containing protein n=1 Tax=Nesidiocoris tenuis TaxID=355587 RepID=A0ABN7BBD5_9HEMI|nr:Hypothetical protein NTJ_14512 [Nesidiocoris tenuis]